MASQGHEEKLILVSSNPNKGIEAERILGVPLLRVSLSLPEIQAGSVEEITRYKLVHGNLPLEKLPSSKELDALAAAYLAWMSFTRPGQIVQKDGLVLPAPE